MKRRALKLLLFLLAGAIINVAVAWACAIRPKPEYQSFMCGGYEDVAQTWLHVAMGELEIRQMGGGWMSISYGLDERPNRLDETEYQSRVPSWSDFKNADPAKSLKGDDLFVFYSEHAFGLPLRAVRFIAIDRAKKNPKDTVEKWSNAWVLPATLSAALEKQSWRSSLPTRPIFPGFAINTIFYAAIVWMLFAVPGAVRRRLRHKRGQCASCGYSLRGTPEIEKCPECGAAVGKLHLTGAQN